MARLALSVAFLLCNACLICNGMDFKADIAAMPPGTDWSTFIQRIPFLGRRLKITSPCIGVHGCGVAMEAMGVASDANNIFDLEAGYAAALYQQFMAMGMDSVRLHLGKRLG